MKKAFHKVLSFTMAFVVLFSTMSFTISSHYCGDSLVDSSFFSKLKTCGMESENQIDTPLKSSDCSIAKKNCCSEKIEIIKGQDELKISFDKISLDQQIFVATFFHVYINLFSSVEDTGRSLKAYPPTLIVRHIYKLDETYLI